MIIYLLKFILCSAALYTAYHLFLRQEKTLRFNRFFLLAIIGLSLWIPTQITKTKYIEVEAFETTYMTTQEDFSQDVQPIIKAPAKAPLTIRTSDVLWSLYGLVSLLLIVRFSRNLWQIQQLKQGGHLLQQQGLNICLRDDILASFTFMNTVFLNKKAFEDDQIPQEILDHETVHARQKHSLDIIVIEALQCLLWFNPIVYLVKSAIKMNHEYLADAQVCEQVTEISQYQKTLIQYVYNSKQQPVLASQLTFGQTKNRLNMMVKNLQLKNAAIRIVTVVAITTGALYGFGEKRVIAQEKQSQNGRTISPEEIQEIRARNLALITLRADQKVKYLNANGEVIESYYGELSKEGITRFQDQDAEGQFYIEPIQENPPSQELLQEFLNEQDYGVWIDDQRVANNELKAYKGRNFHHYYISKLHSNAKNFGKHTYQVDLTTVEAYRKTPFADGGWRSFTEFKEEQKSARIRMNLPPPPPPQMEDDVPGPKLQDKQDVPPPPPPRMISINDKTWVKFEYANGDVVQGEYGKLSDRNKEIFMSPEGKGQILLPPPPPAAFTSDLLEEFANDQYKVWIDGEMIKSADLTNYKPEDFYLYNKQMMVSKDGKERKITGIEFITRKEWKDSGRDKGKWIPFQKAFLPEKN